MNDVTVYVNPVLDVTLDIKDRLRAHLYKLEYLKQEKEDAEMIRASLLPASPTLSDMPKSPGAQCLMLDKLCMISEIDENVKRMVADLAEERKEIERLIEGAIKSPARRTVIRMRYLQGATWDAITERIYGDAGDFADSILTLQRYKDLTHATHAKALNNMRDFIQNETGIKTFSKKSKKESAGK